MITDPGRQHQTRDVDRREKIGRRFKSARTKNGYTLEQVAQRCGVSRNAVQRWESGASFPTPENLATVAGVYGVSVDWILAKRSAALADDEAYLLDAYRALPVEKQKLLREIAAAYFTG